MQISLKVFAQARDLAGADTITVELVEDARVSDLREALSTQYPQLAPLSGRLFIAINQDYASDEDRVAKDDDIACFPPVSGG